MDYYSLHANYNWVELHSLVFTLFGMGILVLQIAYNIDDAIKASRKESTFTLLSSGNMAVLVVALFLWDLGMALSCHRMVA